MVSAVSVSEAARRISDNVGFTVAPRAISDAFYKRFLDDERCPIIGGRRIVPVDYLPEIEAKLRERGVLLSETEEPCGA